MIPQEQPTDELSRMCWDIPRKDWVCPASVGPHRFGFGEGNRNNFFFGKSGNCVVYPSVARKCRFVLVGVGVFLSMCVATRI